MLWCERLGEAPVELGGMGSAMMKQICLQRDWMASLENLSLRMMLVVIGLILGGICVFKRGIRATVIMMNCQLAPSYLGAFVSYAHDDLSRGNEALGTASRNSESSAYSCLSLSST
jgi:hypothetical protein